MPDTPNDDYGDDEFTEDENHPAQGAGAQDDELAEQSRPLEDRQYRDNLGDLKQAPFGTPASGVGPTDGDVTPA